MIVHGLCALSGPPPIVSNERAELPCGCVVYVGVRTDKKDDHGKYEATTASAACSVEHRMQMQRFNQLLRDSLPSASARPLVEVIDEMLTEVAS